MTDYLALVTAAVARKSQLGLRRIPRKLHRITATHADYGEHPPVLVNSFAKSGTHLLAQVAFTLPGTVDYGTFVAMAPPIRFRPRREAVIVRRLRSVVPGELVRAHLWHRDAYAAELRDLNAVHLFVYRDLRDVVISEAHYLADMAPWHALSPYFRRCGSIDARIELSIRGLSSDSGPFYPDIGRRFADYQPWLADPATLAIRFEDMSPGNLTNTVERIVERYAQCARSDFGDGERRMLAEKAAAGIDPSRSHTFREGSSGGWRSVFTAEHRRLFKERAGELLIELGYEKNEDW